MYKSRRRKKKGNAPTGVRGSVWNRFREINFRGVTRVGELVKVERRIEGEVLSPDPAYDGRATPGTYGAVTRHPLRSV